MLPVWPRIEPQRLEERHARLRHMAHGRVDAGEREVAPSAKHSVQPPQRRNERRHLLVVPLGDAEEEPPVRRDVFELPGMLEQHPRREGTPNGRS
jgi:hypothetical protein